MASLTACEPIRISEPEHCPGDANINGAVDVDDLLVVINNYGDCDLPELDSMMGAGSEGGAIGPEDLLDALKEMAVPQEIIDQIEELLNN